MLRPLAGIRVVELAGLAPVPFCGMVLADFGANVTVVRKPREGISLDSVLMASGEGLHRGKRTLTIDYDHPGGIDELRRLCHHSDMLLDPYRAGVLERIGLDPANRKLIFVRLSGYGQFGRMAQKAGHDINYVGMSGVVPWIVDRGGSGAPWPPANLLADFAGGGLTAALAALLALTERQKSGIGCICDCSMVDGVAYLSSFIHAYRGVELLWGGEHSLFSGRCPIYRCYETSDAKWMAVGAIEPKFHNPLLKLLGVEGTLTEKWISRLGELAGKLESIFKSRSRGEWIQFFENEDVCVTPVLSFDDGTENAGIDDQLHPLPAPKLYTAEEYSRMREQCKHTALPPDKTTISKL